jgi:DNA (cytosine-5)-methyltransferase 1
MKPRLLDLFCGAGGASVGYHRAGFDVTGVDIEPHPDYPFELIVGDVTTILADYDPAWLDDFDVIAASPPCQGYTTMSNRWRGQGGKADRHPELIDWTRMGLQAWGGPYVIENVPGARPHMHNPITLHGGMFGLGVNRPRLFESNVELSVIQAPRVKNPVGVYGKSHDGRRLFTRTDGTNQYAAKTLEEGRAAMGIDWMTWPDLTEAIPPAYTEHIGRQLLAHMAEVAA